MRYLFLFVLMLACNGNKTSENLGQNGDRAEGPTKIWNYLALGDSYTVGESVPPGQSFPKQLENALEPALNADITTNIIAVTGWRTDNLLRALAEETPGDDHDLVTLLIGVNNQYQNAPFEVYEREFPELLQKSLGYAGNDKDRVFVISIPDWGQTPFAEGRDREAIATELDAYNAFAKKTTEALGMVFIDITDITRQGLEQPELVAQDGLHPSAVAYERFVARMLPIIKEQLKD
ncbi:SGNH/GDSL hydrolase family protein [Maribacter sp. 2307ULW6-5]|uniref:SGNH/GDSL hydrolase family protein n=1 Tax=Maribacter sp. 2307ULW6-5 TaxID=3386275 RepID=UPI0039BD46B3